MPSSLTLLTLNYVWLWARSAVRAEKEWARQIRWRGLVCGMHPMMRFTDSQIQQLFAWSARCSPYEYRQVFLRSARWKSSYRFFLSIAWSFFQLLQVPDHRMLPAQGNPFSAASFFCRSVQVPFLLYHSIRCSQATYRGVWSGRTA